MAAYRINYSQVKNQAIQMENLSSDLLREISKLRQLQSLTRQYWIGPASLSYQTKLAALIFKLESTRRTMAGVSSTISDTADRLKREDDDTAARAARLKI